MILMMGNFQMEALCMRIRWKNIVEVLSLTKGELEKKQIKQYLWRENMAYSYP